MLFHIFRRAAEERDLDVVDGARAVQRQVRAVPQNYAHAEPIVMLPVDPSVTAITMADPSFQVATGSAVTDASGTRQAAVLFPPNTSAVMTLPDGSTRS